MFMYDAWVDMIWYDMSYDVLRCNMFRLMWLTVWNAAGYLMSFIVCMVCRLTWLTLRSAVRSAVCSAVRCFKLHLVQCLGWLRRRYIACCWRRCVIGLYDVWVDVSHPSTCWTDISYDVLSFNTLYVRCLVWLRTWQMLCVERRLCCNMIYCLITLYYLCLGRRGAPCGEEHDRA